MHSDESKESIKSTETKESDKSSGVSKLLGIVIIIIQNIHLLFQKLKKNNNNFYLFVCIIFD